MVLFFFGGDFENRCFTVPVLKKSLPGSESRETTNLLEIQRL